MEIKPIRSERDYERALRRVEALWDAAQGSEEQDELGVLATLIEAYEREHCPIDMPDPIEAIKFRLEQQGAETSDLVGVIGGRTRVYEVLRGKRPLSLNMIRNLHAKFGIPADVLIQARREGSRRLERTSGSRRPGVRLKKSA
ncbi:MAG: transcriptional regulator [Candidatus Acidiferrum sp.]